LSATERERIVQSKAPTIRKSIAPAVHQSQSGLDPFRLGGGRLNHHIVVMTTIYIDESGFTGDDLYNPDQRYFVIASTIIGDDEAEQLLRRCFPRYQGPEFKFTNIWKRGNNRNGLRALAAEIPALADRAFTFIMDKRFSLLVKMFDYLVEPAAYDSGHDWYADGWGMRYMNTVHRDLLLHGSEELYDETVRLWDAFARSPTESTLATFSEHVDRTTANSKPPISSMFGLLKRGLIDFKALNSRVEEFEDSNEIQVTSVFSSIIWWRQQRPEDFRLVHDESSAFLKQRGMWDAMLRNDLEPQRFPIANGTDVELPIRVRSTTGVRSQDSAAVQLCDVLAGFAAKAAPGLGGGTKDPFILELVSLGAGELVHGGVMPHALYVQGGPRRREGPDVVDRMVDLLRPHLDRVAEKRPGEDGI
jgi:hypothetical protein